MKVRTINPGGVYRSPTDPAMWTYFMMYDNTKMLTYDTFFSAAEALHALREKVYHERKRHGVVNAK